MPLMSVMTAIDGDHTSTSYWMWCPACDDAVRISNAWDWNGSLEKPTFSPSIKTTGVQWATTDGFHKKGHPRVATGKQTVCHSYLTNGIWHFLGDCTHEHANEEMAMVPIPDWMGS